MATKLEIQNLIASNIRSNPSLIDKTEHADVEDALLNELFVGQTEANGNANGFIEYSLRFTKKGNYCILTGSFKNVTNIILGTGIGVNIPSTFAIPFKDVEFYGQIIDNNSNVRLIITNETNLNYLNRIVLLSNLGAGQTVIFNLTYTIKN